MKRSFIFVLFCFFIISCASSGLTPSPEEIRTFEKVFEIPNTSKDDLYIRANTWFVNTFKSSKSVIQFQDKDAGKIMGKYLMPMTYSECISTITVDVKENRARIHISGLVISTGADWTVFLEFLQQALVIWNDLAESLEKELNNTQEW